MAIKNLNKHIKAIVLWYILDEPLVIVRGYSAYARALMEVFPLPFLMLTIIKPWKNIAERKKGHGFNLKEWFERLGFNLFSRAVGATVRMIAMMIGIVCHSVLFVMSAIYAIFWITFPAISLTALIMLSRHL